MKPYCPKSLEDDAKAARSAAEASKAAAEAFKAEIEKQNSKLVGAMIFWGDTASELQELKDQIMSAIADQTKANSDAIAKLMAVIDDKNKQLATSAATIKSQADQITALQTQVAIAVANDADTAAAVTQIAADDSAAQKVIDANPPAAI